VIPTAISLIVHIVLMGVSVLLWSQFVRSAALVSRSLVGQRVQMIQSYLSTFEGAALMVAVYAAAVSFGMTVIWFVRCLTAKREVGRMWVNRAFWLTMLIIGLLAANWLAFSEISAKNIPQLMDGSALVWHIVVFEIAFVLIYWIASALATPKSLRSAVFLAALQPW
jgi:hypothetical protein